MVETKKYFIKQLFLTMFIHLYAITYIWSGAIAYFIQNGIAKIPYLEVGYRGLVITGRYFWMLALLMTFVFCFEVKSRTSIILVCFALLYTIFVISKMGIDIPEDLTNPTALFFFKAINISFLALGFIILISVAVYKFVLRKEPTNSKRNIDGYIWPVQMFLATGVVYYKYALDWPAALINAIFGR